VGSTVQFFVTCLVNEFHPDVGLAVVATLERLGCTVLAPPGQTCCGQPAYNAGFHEEALRVAQHTIDLLDRTSGPIVVPSGSCADMLVHQYPRLFEHDARWSGRAAAVAARCREFTQFVVEHHGASALAGRLRAHVAYHPSCHLLRGLGVGSQPPDLLKAVEGLTLAAVADDEECCGFGGLFSVKQADISSSMLARKIDAIAASGAERLVSCDLGCLLHLEGALHRRGSTIQVQHVAQLLAEAHRS
jgi:L-lactate dehydrogenase complex protein LldE